MRTTWASPVLPVARWGGGTIRDARRRLKEVLAGIGQGRTVVQTARGNAIHARRSLAPAEIAMLSPEWLAIPARDEFSPDAVNEPDL